MTVKTVNARIISGMVIVLEREPIRFAMNKMQTVIVFVVCGLFLWFDRASDWPWDNQNFNNVHCK